MKNIRTGPPPSPVSACNPLTVMSFNIRMGLGRESPQGKEYDMSSEWGRNLDAVINAIRSVDPDIVGLQEVADSSQLQEIATALNMNFAFVWHDRGSALEPWWGVGVLSKHPITASKDVVMSEGRNFIIATVDTGGREIAAVNVHVPYLEKEETSLRQLMRELVDVRLPVVLMGDFNLKPEEKTLDDPGKKRLQPVLDQFLDTAVEAETKSAEFVCLTGTFRNGARIDYVFVENDRFEVLDAGVAPDNHRDASDHVAYFGKLIFKS